MREAPSFIRVLLMGVGISEFSWSIMFWAYADAVKVEYE